MKTRILATALALTMVLGSTCTVFADTKKVTQDTNGNKEANVEVKYTVPESYEVTIPADVDLSSNLTSENNEVTAKKVLIDSSKSLKVSIGSTNYASGYYLVSSSEPTSKISYSIEIQGDKENTSVSTNNYAVLTVTKASTADSENGGVQGSVNLTFKTTEQNIKAAKVKGDHTDTLTFKVSVE